MDDLVPHSGRASRRVAEKLEAEFAQQVGYSYNQGAKDKDAQQLIAKPQKECELLNSSRSNGRASNDGRTY